MSQNYGELNGSSYYRANPFYQQGYLPDSAFRNRKQPNFMVELPQGNQFFQPTNKKHFQNLGYRSTISQQQIMHKQEQPQDFPAKNRQFFRSLNTVDIEGANTNTLISKAVKNKMKAHEQLERRNKEQKDQQIRHRLMQMQKMQDQEKRMQALVKIRNQNKEQLNYHQKQKRLRTEGQSQQQLPPESMHKSQLNQQIQNSQQSNIEQYHRQQLQRAEWEKQEQQRKINQLQRELRGQEKERSEMQKYNQSRQAQAYHQYLKAQKEREQIENIRAELKQRQKAEMRKNQEASLEGYQNHRRTVQNYEDELNRGIRQVDNQRQRAITEKPSIVSAPSREQQNNQERRPAETRQILRKMNPTYLSFGSPSIGLAGKNIVGY